MIQIRSHSSFGLLWLLVAAIVLSGPVSARAQAPVGDVFEIRGVAVDVTAQTADAARTQALRDGQLRAFDQVLRRLTVSDDHALLPRLSAEDISLYVRDFEVASEKTSAVRYIANLNVRFSETAVRDLLNELGITFAETPSKPVLLVPVFQSGGAMLLWDDPNPWRDAWNANQPVPGMVPMVLPLGDLTDVGAIGAVQAVEGDRQQLVALANGRLCLLRS